MKNGHVYLTEDQHYYSVPCELIGKKIKLQYSRSQVELYLNYELIATHKRIRSPHNYTTDPAHLPMQHRYVSEWSPGFFMEKAKAIDPVVEHYISQVLAKKQHPEQATEPAWHFIYENGFVTKEYAPANGRMKSDITITKSLTIS
ncbi:MAG: hypothetical protein IPO32_19835 [Crocinitomicaceae bacterium]|nr:hypothetical protein [Crocinitomicaceae bacterium]